MSENLQKKNEINIQEITSQIKDSLNIVNVINDYGVPLEKKGNNYQGLCPFHNEKTPSFKVNEEKQIFTCFGCGASGDVIEFIKQKENVKFMEAVKILNDKYNLGIKLTGAKKKKTTKKLDQENVINYHIKKYKKLYDSEGNLKEGVTREEAYHLANLINDIETSAKNKLVFPYIDDTGEALPTWENIEALLDHKNIIVKYNELSKEIVIENLKSYDYNSQVMDIHSQCLYEGLKVTLDYVNKSITRISRKNTFNPVIEYLNECGMNWNGQSIYIKKVVDCLIADNNFDEELKYLLVERWLLNTVNIAFNQGASNVEGVLVLQGVQGCGKTSFIKTIIPSDFLKTGLDLDPSNIDSVRKCTKYWVVELGELDATMKSDQAKLKAFITESIDEYRLPYAIAPVKYNRLTSFFGTVNKSNFLKDETGDRRYWVIPVKEIDLEQLRQIDINQLWGEVMNLLPFKINNLNLNKEEQKKLSESNKDFRVKGNTQIKVESCFLWSQDEKQWEFMSTSEIANLLGLTTTSGLKEAIESCGGKAKRTNKSRGYIVPTLIEIK